MRLYHKLIYFAFIYLISNNKSVLVESTNNSSTVNLSQEEDGNQNTGVSDGGFTASGANETDGTSSGLTSPTSGLKLFKDDGSGNAVEMVKSDVYEDNYLDNLTYAFKPGVKCTLVKFGEAEVWKKGDQQVDEPKSVTYDSILEEVTVRDADKSVHFGKDGVNGEWKHVVTIPRTKMVMAVKKAESATKVGSPGSGLSSPKPDDGASTGTPEPAQSPEEVDEGSDKEPEEASTVASEAPDANEVSKDAGLRGTPVSAEAPKEADETSSLASDESKPAGGDAGHVAGEPGDTKLADAGSSEGGETAYPGVTPREGQVAEGPPKGSGMPSGGADGQTGEKGEKVDGSQGGVALPPPASEGSGTHTSSGEGTETANGSSDKGAGEGEDDSQPTEGSQSAGDSTPVKLDQDGTGTPLASSGGDGSTQVTTPPTNLSGSSTPPATTGGDGTPLNPGQDGSSATPTAGGTDLSSKTGVELSLKKTSGTNEFSYNKVGNVVTYTAKDGFGFSSVKTKKGGCSGCGSSCCGSDVAIWDAKDSTEYASKVVLYGKGKKEKVVIITLLDGTKKAYKKDKNNPWSECDSKTIPVSISTGIGRDTPFYTYKNEDWVGTFTPKEGFAFNEVICDCDSRCQTIWKTTNENEYANKVEMEGPRRARIHLEDGSVKVYKLSDFKWREDTQATMAR